MSGTSPIGARPATGEARMADSPARARVWTLCLCALVLCALTGPLVGLLTPLAPASAATLHVVAAVLAALVGAYVALAALLIVAVLRVVRPRFDGHH